MGSFLKPFSAGNELAEDIETGAFTREFTVEFGSSGAGGVKRSAACLELALAALAGRFEIWDALLVLLELTAASPSWWHLFLLSATSRVSRPFGSSTQAPAPFAPRRPLFFTASFGAATTAAAAAEQLKAVALQQS